MPKSFQIKLSFPSCVLSMPPIPSFSISSPLKFGNSCLRNFQLLFGPNLPFTGLNFIFFFDLPKPERERLQKQNTTTVHVQYTLPARQREDLESVQSRSEVQTLSHAIMRSRETLLCPCFQFQKTIIQYS